MPIFSLLFHFHLKTGFQFHHNLLIKNGDPLNWPSGEGFAVLRNGCGHFFQESNHVVHSCLQVGSLRCLSKDVLTVSTKVINLKSQFFHQFVIARVVDHLPLKFCKLLIDCCNPCFQVIKDRFLDVRFQKRNDGVPSCVGIVDRCDDCPVKDFFLHRSCRTIKIHLSLENSADASPERGFAASVVPLHPAVNVSAVSAEHHAGKSVLATVNSTFAIRIQIGLSSNLRFDFHEHIPVNYGFVTAFHIVFRHLAVVGSTFLVQDADRVGLLQKGIADVLLVGKNLMDIALMPFQMPCSVGNAVCFQASLDLQETCPFQLLPVDAADNLCLLRVNDQAFFSILGVVVLCQDFRQLKFLFSFQPHTSLTLGASGRCRKDLI